jgi:predicted component of type VI protein secretion system
MSAACHQEPLFVPAFNLKLTIIACHGKALASGASAVFDASGGTIGLDAGNTLVLPDDDGVVARRHATVRALADGWQLLNTSEHAAIALNGKLLAPGAQAGLSAGDILNIGAYVLQTATNAWVPGWSPPIDAGATEAACTLGSSFGSSTAAAGPDSLQNSLQTNGLAAGHPTDPLSGAALSTSLHDLLDTPLDPLALFGMPSATATGSGWNDPDWNKSADGGLFADLAGAPSGSSFTALQPDSSPGHAIRDDVPEFGGHLRLKIASPPDNGQTPEPIARRAAASPLAESPLPPASQNQPAENGDALGVMHEAPACVVRTAVPDYSGRFHAKNALRNDGPVKLREPFAPPVHSMPPIAPAEESSVSPAALVRAFLEGAGVTPDAITDTALSPELMHTLGTLVRVLKRQVM